MNLRADNLVNLREDHTELGNKVDLMHSEMGLLSRKLDELIRMTSLVHHSAKLALIFKPFDLDHPTIVADHIIQSTPTNRHFT